MLSLNFESGRLRPERHGETFTDRPYILQETASARKQLINFGTRFLSALLNLIK